MADPDGLGEAGIPVLLRLAGRDEGVTIAEVADELALSYYAARRYVRRAVRRGIIERTSSRRRRVEVFGAGGEAGVGGIVFLARGPSRPRRGRRQPSDPRASGI